jgi:hypothetical protein
MPTKKMAQQTGNSCAAHCTVIAVAELLNDSTNMTPNYAEKIVWPAIQFVPGENSGATDPLAKEQASDPRKVVDFVNGTFQGKGIQAKLLCDDRVEAAALNDVPNNLQSSLDGLYKLIKGSSTALSIDIQQKHFYSCTFLAFDGPSPGAADYSDLHNILVTNDGSSIWYYNPNETAPDWVNSDSSPDWMTLKNQNAGEMSYVFTGLCVDISKS